MYCPRCGHQPNAEEMRFCSSCGFRLAVVKASLMDANEAPVARLPDSGLGPALPRQRDINVGVTLMSLGTLVATYMAARGGVGAKGGACILAAAFTGILLLSRPLMKTIYRLLSWHESTPETSTTQRGMGFGATLMFLSTIGSAIASELVAGRMRSGVFFYSVLASFVLLMFISPYLLRALRYLLIGEVTRKPSPADATSDLIRAAGNAAALPAGEFAPISILEPKRGTTAEMVMPPSVTEQTTNLLNDK